MSEYQYYEFAAIERPLTKEEMAELRALSSRATISATRFANEYHWGDLKGDPTQWMRRYFDAFVYTANWCSCRFALKVPRNLLKKTDLKHFQVSDALTIEDAKTHWIIDWSLDEGADEERFAMEDGRSWMGRLAPLRDELMRGDTRPLYLGWLAGLAGDDVDDDAMEPPVPTGLAQLSAAQQALVEFLEIDPNLLNSAAAASGEPDVIDDGDSVETWIAGLSKGDMALAFKLILQGQSPLAEQRVKSDYRVWQQESGTIAACATARRTVGDLLALAEQASEGDT